MDFVAALTLFIILFIVFSLCGFCCRSKRKGTIFSTPVVVTSATHTAPGGYPTGIQVVPVYPTSSATGYQQATYPQQAPYPVSGPPSAMPMPMQQQHTQPNQIGMNPNMAPYPSAGHSMNPPSYDAAVGPYPNQTGYEKQSPYNPSYPTGY